MAPSNAWAALPQQPHVAGLNQVLELVLCPSIYGPGAVVTDDGSPARCRLGPEFLDGLLPDVEIRYDAEMIVQATVAPDLGDGEQLDAALACLAQLGQGGLELGPDLLVLCAGGLAEDAQLAEVDAFVVGERMEVPPEDERLLRGPSLPACRRALVVPTTTSPGETASSHGVRLMEDGALCCVSRLIV